MKSCYFKCHKSALTCVKQVELIKLKQSNLWQVYVDTVRELDKSLMKKINRKSRLRPVTLKMSVSSHLGESNRQLFPVKMLEMLFSTGRQVGLCSTFHPWWQFKHKSKMINMPKWKFAWVDFTVCTKWYPFSFSLLLYQKATMQPQYLF